MTNVWNISKSIRHLNNAPMGVSTIYQIHLEGVFSWLQFEAYIQSTYRRSLL